MASKRRRINVTGEHIERGINRDSAKCPIAEAIFARYPDADYPTIAVDLQTIRFSIRPKGERYIFLTPLVCQDFIVDFDAGDTDLKPFAFELRSPQVTKIRKRKYRGADPHHNVKRATAAAAVTPPITDRVKFVPVGNRGEAVPTIVGGRPPPSQRRKGVPVNRLRQYGIRALRK